jgi:hypothetical protein
MIFSLMVSFWSPQSAAAADGTQVSTTTPTYGIATGASFDGQRACVVWSTFQDDSGNVDVEAFIRIYTVSSGTWSNTFQLTDGGFASVAGTRCTFDSNNNLHAVWQQKYDGGSVQIAHRYMNTGGGWSGVATVDSDGDAPDIAADNNGRVWLVHRKYQGDSNSQVYVRSWQGGNWSSPQVFTTSGPAGLPRVGADNNGYVHFAWQNGGTSRSYAFYNSNNGQFSSEIGIPGSNNAGNFGMTVNRSTGDVHFVYAKSATEIHYAKKTGSGATSIGNDVVIANASAFSYNVTIAWSAGLLTVVFDNGNKQQISSLTSTNEGASWGGVTTLANPGSPVQAPWVSQDSTGGTFIAYAHPGSSVYFIAIAGVAIPENERCAGFADVRNTNPACNAIAYLTGRGVINGYSTTPPTFGPNDAVQRAQMAAFIVRGLSWQNRPTTPRTFNDFGSLVGELQTASLILANACDTSNNCVAKGYGDGRFGPNNSVTYAEVIAFIARAEIINGSWRSTPNGAQPYSGVPAAFDADVRTYVSFVGSIPNAPSTSEVWNSPAPRAWVAQVLYGAFAPR